MVSRLDRLFILLDTGSNEAIRLAAAKQLGEVQRIQPNDLNYLLQRIKEYSCKLNWETRVAAGNATKYVLEHVGSWPPPIKIELSQDINKLALKVIEDTVDTEEILDTFDLDKIMSLCPTLLSVDITDTEESEMSNINESCGTSKIRGKSKARKGIDKEQLMRQRRLINKELGIMDSLNIGIKSTDIVSNDDLQVGSDVSTVKSSSNQQDARVLLLQSVSNYERLLEDLNMKGCISLDDGSNCGTSQAQVIDTIETSNKLSSFVWPLSSITKQYSDDLFNPAWEIRHGAAIALREIVRLHGKSAGKRSDVTQLINEKLNQIWLVDMALRSLCVLILDKFGDFLFDQVIAPVRENAAQLLGCCVASMSESNATHCLNLVLKTLENSSWEVRHGGVIGLKYSLNVKSDKFSRDMLRKCFDPLFKRLGDNVDDVSAEAAAALVPVKDLMIETIPEEAPRLIKFLWEHLADLDELTTSTSNIVLLLASLITSSSTALDPSELTKSIPKLWPLLSHSSTAVRVSVLEALITLIKSQKYTCLSWMPQDLIATALRLLFQRSILENMKDVLPHIERVWMQLIQVDSDPDKSQKENLQLLQATSQYLNYWLCLTMQPLNAPIDRASPMWLNIKHDGTISQTKPDGDVYIGSCTFNAETIDIQKSQVTKCRLLGAKLIGSLYAQLVSDFKIAQHSSDTLKYLGDMFSHYIRTKSANQRIVSGWALELWANYQVRIFENDQEKLINLLPTNLSGQLDTAIHETNLCYDELASNFTRLQQETREFVAFLIEANILPSGLGNLTHDKRTIYNLTQIQMLSEINLIEELSRIATKKFRNSNSEKLDQDVSSTKLYTQLTTKKIEIVKNLKSTTQSQQNLSISVMNSLSCAHIAWRLIPNDLNSIINPLIDILEISSDQMILDKSNENLAILLDILCDDHEKHMEFIEGIRKRLLDILSCRVTIINLEIEKNKQNKTSGSSNANSSDCLENQRIIFLDNLQRLAEQGRNITRRQSSISSAPTNLKRSLSLSSSSAQDIDLNELNDEHNSHNRNSELIDTKIRGANEAFSFIVKKFGQKLPEKLPIFWKSVTTDVKVLIDAHLKSVTENDCPNGHDTSEKLAKGLFLLEVVGQNLDDTLQRAIFTLLPDLIQLLTSPNPMIRHRSSQCIGTISKLMINEAVELISNRILPMLHSDNSIIARCGSIEAIASIIEHLQLNLVNRINMFMIPVLKTMSDQNEPIRLMATHCFAKLLSLMPLNLQKNKELNARSDEKFDSNKSVTIAEATQIDDSDDQRFIEQLLDPKKLDKFSIPFDMNAELRSYQQDGLNWLWFLNRFSLHGILCDEMGLGKTFMTICIVASDHILKETQSKNEQTRFCQPSLIVCPSTLTEHWLYEFEKFLPIESLKNLKPISYTGSLNERLNIRRLIVKQKSEAGSDTNVSKLHTRKLIVTSYDIIRNDIDFFKEVRWNYCVLDEGHMIKNGKTKLSKAIRLLNANHRLILSGTPIQNNVTELWSLFDFLMPGYLGTERQFNNRYAKPILQSREPKCSPRELESGALAMESLHRQVLPFILRRLKDEVLDDLPPKIIQDYYCELSPLQMKLYEDFTKSDLCKEVTRKSLDNLINNPESTDTKLNSRQHIFQALQYLKNVCNHPKLVLTEKHSKYQEIKKNLENEKSSLDDISHSSKLKALKQLLLDCGIGVSGNNDDQQQQQQQQQSLALDSVVNQHRALVFCQIRSMVNIIENDLLKKHLPSITYLKLDGSIPPNQRHSIVSRFNNDPSIDILLLTTQIGGLGLNLTGADTVIFVEHDWNPTKDTQAMDRAHRIGQKKVVNVYRLITKSTLEERIMGLQKFKTMVSNTVINHDNSGLNTMNVDQLFDLFEPDKNLTTSATNLTGDKQTSAGLASCKRSDTRKGSLSSSFIDLLPELWDKQQYETEYDLSNFVSSLKN